MLRLRLKRIGSKKRPFYRIVAADSRAPRDGKFIETLGTYDPRQQPSAVTLKEDRIRHWLDNGGQPSETVRGILVRNGIEPTSEVTSA